MIIPNIWENKNVPNHQPVVAKFSVKYQTNVCQLDTDAISNVVNRQKNHSQLITGDGGCTIPNWRFFFLTVYYWKFMTTQKRR